MDASKNIKIGEGHDDELVIDASVDYLSVVNHDVIL